jgi:ribosomal protein L2
VARKATQSSALSQNSLSLLGLYGSKGEFSAMVRLPSGRVKTVRPGSRLANGKVLGIDATGLVLEKSGRTQKFEMPGS